MVQRRRGQRPDRSGIDTSWSAQKPKRSRELSDRALLRDAERQARAHQRRLERERRAEAAQ